MNKRIRAIAIGGSAGSFQVITEILKEIPNDFKIPIFLCFHRLKHIREGFVEALSIHSNIPIVEPDDKEKIKPGIAYLAPANYHMYIELNRTIALSTEELVNFSRPSIDITLQSAGYVYHKSLVGIILSGANKDGAFGLKKIKDNNGYTIIQYPKEAVVPTMPEASEAITQIDEILTTKKIIKFLTELHKNNYFVL